MYRRVSLPTQASQWISAEALFRAHAGFIAGFVKRLGVASEEVEDIVQEVFLTVHRKGGFAPEVAKPTTWLAEIAIRVVSTHRRTVSRRRTSKDDNAIDAAVSTKPSPLETTEQRAALERVEKALGALDVDRRAVFVLYEIEGETGEAIASGLGIPIGTVHSRLFAARKIFFEAYARLEKSPLNKRVGDAPTSRSAMTSSLTGGAVPGSAEGSRDTSPGELP